MDLSSVEIEESVREIGEEGEPVGVRFCWAEGNCIEKTREKLVEKRLEWSRVVERWSGQCEKWDKGGYMD